MSFGDDFNIEDIYGLEDKIYLMTRCLFCLHNLCASFDLYEKEKETLHKILFCLVTITDNDDSRNRWRYSFLNSMMASTLPTGELWFAQAVRDYDYPGFIFSFDTNVTGFFYLIYCFYLYAYSKYLSNETKEKILEFTNEPSKGLNSDGLSWKQYAKRDIESCNDRYLITFIHSLIKIYRASSETLFYIHSRKGGFVGANVEFDFNKMFLFNVWLEMLIFNPYVIVSENLLLDTIDFLIDEDKKILVNVLSDGWIKDNQLNKDSDVGFLSFIGIKPNLSENYGNKNAIKALSTFREKYLKARIEKEVTSVTDDKLAECENKIKEYFNAGMVDNPLIDKTISLNDEKNLYISTRIPSEGIDSIVDQYQRLLKDYFYRHIRAAFDEIQKPNMIISEYTLTKEEAEKVLKFEPDFMTSSNYLFSEAEIDLNELNNIKRVEGSYLPTMLFWKNDGIVANFEFDDENSRIRPLSNEEVNHIIDNEYTMVNGLYKYGRYGKDDKNSILISRDELCKYLINSIYIVIISFKSKVIIDSSKILWIKHEDKK